jgi:hypothetical protein
VVASSSSSTSVAHVLGFLCMFTNALGGCVVRFFLPLLEKSAEEEIFF